MRHREIMKALDISPSFLDEHREAICKQILSAGKALPQYGGSYKTFSGSRRQADIVAINQCLSAARTVLTLGSSPDRIGRVLRDVEKDPALANQDPVTVINSSVVYYLITELDRNPETTEQDRKTLEHLHHRFDDVNWMVDSGAVRSLGIEPVEQPANTGNSSRSGRVVPKVRYGDA